MVLTERIVLNTPEAIKRKRDRLGEPHVARLTKFVDGLRAGPGRAKQGLAPGFDPQTHNVIPYFDPDDGGVEARVLMLVEAPGPGAVRSGFISSENPDQTARNFFGLRDEAGLERRELVTWNIVPWYVGDGQSIRGVTSADIAEAAPYLEELLQLLPRLEAVLTMGRKATDGWKEALLSLPEHESLRHFSCPHPSPTNLRTRPASVAQILETLRDVQAFLGPR